MEAVVEIVALLFKAIAWLLCSAVMGFLQALVGILYPAKNHKMVLYQRCTAVILAAAMILLLTGIFLVNIGASGANGYLLIGMSLILMIASGAAGGMVEQESKRDKTDGSRVNKESLPTQHDQA